MKKEYILVSKAKVKKIYRLNIEKIKSLLNDAVRNQLIDSHRLETDPEKKRLMKLEMWATIPQADDFTDDIRHDDSAVPSKIVYADFDSADNPHMGDSREYYMKYIAPQLDELHAFDVHVTVSGKGLHIGFERPQNATIAQAQEWIGKMVGLVPDRKCTNLSRLFIMPKAEDYLYLDLKALFGEKEAEPYTIDLTEVDVYEPGTSIYTDEEVANLMYNGIKAQDIVATTLQKIVKHPLPIVEGERNDTFLKAGLELMPLVKDENILVKLFEPYGLSDAERRQVCKNVAKYAAKGEGTLSKTLRKTIQELREEEGLVTTARLLPCRQRPKNLPPLIREIIAVMPPEWRNAVDVLMHTILGTLCTKVRSRYLDFKMHSTTFWAHVVGKQAGGKSTLIDWLTNHLMASIRQQDELARQEEREYAEAVRKAKNSDHQPEDPKPVIREVPFVISNAALLKRLAQAGGLHIVSICDEVDTVIKTNNAGAWSSKTDIYRNAFDNQIYGQDYLSENSYSGMFPVVYNGLSGGTEDSTERYLGKHVHDGLAGRIAITGIEEGEGGKMPIIKQLTPKQEAAIQQGIQALEAAEGEVHLPRTLKALEKWLEEKFRLYVETTSEAINVFRKRAAVMGFRAAIIAYILFGYKEKQAVVDYALYIADYVLQQQVARWGDRLENGEQTSVITSVVNNYRELPDEFTREDFKNLRIINNQPTNINMILSRWRKAGMIEDIDKNTFRKIGTQA